MRNSPVKTTISCLVESNLLGTKVWGERSCFGGGEDPGWKEAIFTRCTPDSAVFSDGWPQLEILGFFIVCILVE